RRGRHRERWCRCGGDGARARRHGRRLAGAACAGASRRHRSGNARGRGVRTLPADRPHRPTRTLPCPRKAPPRARGRAKDPMMADGKSPEPLSRAALEVLRKGWPSEHLWDFMETARTDRVRDQLQRYCRGEQDGVSILISGTRGMGKTTMAKLVVQRLIAED